MSPIYRSARRHNWKIALPSAFPPRNSSRGLRILGPHTPSRSRSAADRVDARLDVLRLIHAQLRDAGCDVLAAHRRREFLRLQLLLHAPGLQRRHAVRPDLRARDDEPGQLVDREQRLRHRRLARRAAVLGVAEDRRQDLFVHVAPLARISPRRTDAPRASDASPSPCRAASRTRSSARPVPPRPRSRPPCTPRRIHCSPHSRTRNPFVHQPLRASASRIVNRHRGRSFWRNSNCTK